ncbi:MAG: hypothetical protein M1833_001041 [Piccolia ochrophora]|nr:MAG: hypothetical protein M1833_001041 [Piccolia ochrophora]
MPASGDETSPLPSSREREEENPEDDATASPVRFPPEEEATLLSESNAQKASANTLFTTSRFPEAIVEYNAALTTCPNYLDFEVAVLRSNIAACHLKLSDWKAAIEAASASLKSLDRLEGVKPDDNEQGHDEEVKKAAEDVVEDIISPGAERIGATQPEGKRSQEDVQRIRGKALMRRAKARLELGGWAALQGAEEDYKLLSTFSSLAAPEKKLVHRQLSLLPPRIEAAKQQEMGEMMGKLKELGNGILKPFGLSTDNFNMVKDDKTGGYSMNFNQGEK